jgi:hypothetical protein
MLLNVVVLAALSSTGVACAAFRSTSAFVPVPGETRVRYEPGARPPADIVAAALPEAVATVERALGGPFADPPAVFVCATLASFEAHTGNPKAGGHTIAGRIFISPKPENTPQRLPRVLTHELVHLHFAQRMGAFAYSRHLPPWFAEGIAVMISGGAGAEQVSELEAARAIAGGRRIEPKEAGSFFGRDLGPGVGLSVHMFYRQGALLTEFLREADPSAFTAWVRALESGEAFGPAFERAYRAPLSAWWNRFLATETERAGAGGVN